VPQRGLIVSGRREYYTIEAESQACPWCTEDHRINYLPPLMQLVTRKVVIDSTIPVASAQKLYQTVELFPSPSRCRCAALPAVILLE
jgi:hypothetical protein